MLIGSKGIGRLSRSLNRKPQASVAMIAETTTSTGRVSRSASAETMKQSGPATTRPSERIVKANTVTAPSTMSGPRMAHRSSRSPPTAKLCSRSSDAESGDQHGHHLGQQARADARELAEGKREGAGVADRGDAQQKQPACEIERRSYRRASLSAIGGRVSHHSPSLRILPGAGEADAHRSCWLCPAAVDPSLSGHRRVHRGAAPTLVSNRAHSYGRRSGAVPDMASLQDARDMARLAAGAVAGSGGGRRSRRRR